MLKIRNVLVVLVLALTARIDAQVIPIAVARSLPAGTVVTVEGSVTVPSGSFASSTFDKGFALQDETGGIYVSTAESSNLNFHRKVRVTGEVSDDGFGLLVLRPASLADVTKLPGASRVEPEPLPTGAISEATEGLLVEIRGVLSRPIVNDLPFGYQVFVNDGSGETQIFIPASTGINPFRIPFLVRGDEIVAVGYSGQFLSQYEVLPRHRGDIRPAH